MTLRCWSWASPNRAAGRATLLVVFILSLLLAACAEPAERGVSSQPTGEVGPEEEAAEGELEEVTLAVGGAAAIVYLPTTLAQQLGYYEEEGISANIQDFDGGSEALQAVLGGSADVVSGFYDHTIQMAAKNQDLTAFVTMLRYPGLVLLASPNSEGVESVEDLAGGVVGVSAPGSSTHLFLNYLLSKQDMSQDAVSVTGIGTTGTAIAAMEQGDVVAGVLVDPAVSQLRSRNPDLTVLADTRTQEGVQEAFGTDSYPASVLYARDGWIEENPETAAGLARAIQRTLQWIQEHSPEEIVEQMPPQYREEQDIYLEAVENTMAMFSPDGLMQPEGPEAVLEVLSLSVPEVGDAEIEVDDTYTNEFVTGG
jgi:NitT/TauT family transport system substrate-binding protein